MNKKLFSGRNYNKFTINDTAVSLDLPGRSREITFKFTDPFSSVAVTFKIIISAVFGSQKSKNLLQVLQIEKKSDTKTE